MEINFTTEYKKQLKYYIYGIYCYGKNREKRKLIKKGKLNENCKINFKTESEDIIIRIRKNSYIATFFLWLTSVIIDLSTMSAIPGVLFFYELRFPKVKEDEILNLVYYDLESPIVGSYDNPMWAENRGFYCINHISKVESKKLKSVNRVFKISVIAILVMLVLLLVCIFTLFV